MEPYGAGDSEYAAGQRLLRRAVAHLGRRFADYVVVDSAFATAPFLHGAGELGLKVVARLKDNLPELWTAAQKRFAGRPPRDGFWEGEDRVEIWEADDFDPWESLCWTSVRVLRYRQRKPIGEVVEAWWLTNFSSRRVGGPTLYRMAKSRWEIENQGFHEAKSRHGLEPICHHETHSVLMQWLITALALTIERLYRLR
ncbi:MAG: transposase [Bryobacteraceae bacterium]